jgi:hypothetical protein
MSAKLSELPPTEAAEMNITARAEYVRSAVMAFPWSGTEIPAALNLHETCQAAMTEKRKAEDGYSNIFAGWTVRRMATSVEPSKTSRI